MKTPISSTTSSTLQESTSYNFMREILLDVIQSGTLVESRIGSTIELSNINASWSAGTYYTRPKMNEWIGWTELLQLISGTFSHKTYQLLAPNAQLELFTPNMAYGPRIFDQWGDVVHELRVNRDSRRAVIYVGHHDELIYTRPCTVSIQFMIRNNVLDTYVTMRSWDIYKGLPYDVMMFSGIAAITAQLVDAKPGIVSVNAASAHVYQLDLDVIDFTEDKWKTWQMTFTYPMPDTNVKDIREWSEDIELQICKLSSPKKRKEVMSTNGIILAVKD